MDWLYDDRTDCWSVLTTLKIRDYIDLVKTAHAERGALSGQRDVLKTTTAKRIRDRMVSDIRAHAVLPPVVLGAVVDKKTFDRFPLDKSEDPSDFLSKEAAKNLSIMIAANQDVFGVLDRYCASLDDPVRNSGAPRWIATNADDRSTLKYAELRERLSFSPARAVLRFDLGTDCLICASAFEFAVPSGGLVEIDVGAGLLTVVLAELKPRPRGTTTQVRDVVEASDKNADANYGGHDATTIASLFAPIRAFSASNVSPQDTWRIFFLLCLEECRHGESWIDDHLASTLRSICELEQLNIPYRTLCRSIFDADPAALFLALYRCIEALYAYSSAQRVIAALNLQQGWIDVATVLEDELDWHPREESSLTSLLNQADPNDLATIFMALGEAVPENSASLAASASRRIYQLRNGLVHFRPAHHHAEHGNVDWNRLCEASATIVWHIYSNVFSV